ncbi:MAG: NIPSNAP family protein [Gemmatimonadota bacterium]
MPVRRLTWGMGALVVLALASFAGFRVGVAAGQGRDARVYELRTYTTRPGRLPALHRRFSEHTIALFEKHGMRNEMYWTPTDSAHHDNTLVYLLSHDSQAAADANWKAFGADPDWIKVREASEADGPILASPPVRVFMTLTGFSPAPMNR